ncbi:hypothetical protein JCM11641_002346 [Rhodosporidiobolus odoratus]
MDSTSYLITGASRSLGLGYTKQLLVSSTNVKVIATARNPDKADALQALATAKENEGRVYLLKMDVEDAEGVKAAAQELEESGFLGETGGLDVLVNNAGVCEHRPVAPTLVTKEQILDNLGPNLFGVLNVTQAFLPLLRKGKGKKIISVSSVCGSIGGPYGENDMNTAYCISKVALNMYMRKISRELDSCILANAPELLAPRPGLVDPGYVQTDMNAGKGNITIEEATKAATEKVFLKVTQKDNGTFTSYSGEAMPW